MSRRKQVTTEAVVVGEGLKAILTNQTSWFFDELLERGDRGLTKADYPGLHVGDIVMRIRRKLGNHVISCVMEPNTGPWGGEHGRYRLNAEVTVRKIPSPKKTKPAAGATAQALNSKSKPQSNGGLNVEEE